MITCPKCFKENQDHYKFCLGCGAELPRDVAPKPFTGSNTPPHGVAVPAVPPTAAYSPQGPAATGQTAQPPPQQAAAPLFGPADGGAPPATSGGGGAAATSPCPQCGHMNGPNNLFCGSCGFRLGGAPKSAVAPSAAAPTGGPGSVVLTALRADGSEAGSYTLPNQAHVYIGRETGHIFASDSYLSPRHASFTKNGNDLSVRDEGSLNGVYRKLSRDVPVELRPNDVFRIGQEIIRFEPIQHEAPSPDGVERLGSPSKGYVGRIALIIGRETTGNAFPVPEAGMHLGRERGDVLFPEDGYVSGLHCRLAWDKGKLFLTDLGSSNGTFMRLREETDLRTGDVLLMGQQLFRLSI